MGQWGKAKCLWENPSSCQLPFLYFSPIIYFCQNVVELVIAWNGKSMGNQIRIGQRTIFGKTCSDFLGKENAQKRMPFCYASTFFHFPHNSPSRWSFWEQLEFFLCLSFQVFGCWLHFFPWMGGRFCSAGDWVVFLTFLELLVHFSIHVFVISCVFTMAVKSHSRFWLSHWLLVSRTGYLGRFSLLWVVLPNKLQDCYFSPCCEPFLLLRLGTLVDGLKSFFPGLSYNS